VTINSLQVEAFPNATLLGLLRNHPRVTTVSETDSVAQLSWDQGSRKRAIFVGDGGIEPRGVIELTDNNPLVCTDIFSLPSAAGTLAVLALGPLAEAGLLVERPTMLVNVRADEVEIAPFLAPLGWSDGLTVSDEPTDLGGAIAATVICKVPTPDRLEDLDDLYEERYGRSFFVRRDDEAEWHVSLVIGKPYAIYRLRISPDDPLSLLAIQIMAGKDGKCGAAQIVHAMNVMCGFEESLGIA
jgi:hypothetical protein